MFRQRHHGGDRRLIVPAQQSGSVGQDQILADVLFQDMVLGGFHHDVLFPVQQDIPAVVVFQDPRADTVPADVRRRVHVCDEGQRFREHGRRRRDAPVNDTGSLVIENLRDADPTQFGEKFRRHVPLAGRGRAWAGDLSGLGIDGRVAQQALRYGFMKA